MENQEPSRDQEIKDIRIKYKFFYQILGGILLVAIGTLLGAVFFSSPPDKTGYLINLYTSALSIAATVFILDLLSRRRDESRRIADFHEQLIYDAGSTSNETAKRAISELRKRGNLKGDSGLLRNADLSQSNLEGAQLMGANLQGATLTAARMKDVDISGANFKNASLAGADFKSAVGIMADFSESYLVFTCFESAFLARTNFQSADLSSANFKGASLLESNLQLANVNGAEFDTATVLPDGTKWTPETDLTRFGAVISITNIAKAVETLKSLLGTHY